MATQWFWQADEREGGPVSFRELAVLVQEHTLNEEDLVRPDYSTEWERAYRVVGLFNMARRVPREILELQPASSNETVAVDAVFVEPVARDEAPSLNSIDSAAARRVEAPPPDLKQTANPADVHDTVAVETHHENPDPSAEEAARLATGGSLQVAIDSATNHLDQRSVLGSRVAGRWTWLTRFWPASRTSLGPFASLSLRHSYRLALAGLAVWGASSWLAGLAQAEDQRFPGWSDKLPTKVLPVIGVCSPEEYAFYSWDIVLGAGIVAYCFATWMERHATDA